ncbi:MAG TPA: M1 family aminopeptidase, partial [Candidatus Elarobacter sp.]|nr:M1 family aminopeptidase [Candidatus Elarobacter sp.]
GCGVLAFMLAALLATSSPAPAAGRARLGDDAAPVAYDLTITADPDAPRSMGRETIELDVRRPIAALTLNDRGVAIRSAAIDGMPAQSDLDVAVEQVRLATGRVLEPGRHVVTLAFDAPARSAADADGMFAGIDGAITTAFEPSTARTLFPCFDEPQFRAGFTLHVRAPAAFTVVSNMPLRAQHVEADGFAMNDFEPSPPMAAYVLTIDAGRFAHVDGEVAGLPVRVFVRPGQEDRGRAVLADVERILPFEAALFGRPFPLPKLDVVVANGALQSAFEGWGAVTFYSEGQIFGAQFGGGEHGRRFAASILAHELAHQWSGDLVGMRWWSDTFVSEAVAQFVQHEAMRAVFTELHGEEDRDADIAGLLAVPVSAGAHAVVHPIVTDLNAEDFTAFSWPAYVKGAAAIEGWRDVAGDAAVRAGLQRYIVRHAGQTATFDDFWHEVGGAPALAYARSWLTQPGFPVVDVRARCAGDATVVRLAQAPFASDDASRAASRGRRWIVPVVVREGAHERRVLMSSARTQLTLPGCSPVAIDPSERPYYLVRYAPAAYAALARGGADTASRARLVVDTTALHAASQAGDAEFLRVVDAARDPLPDSVWTLLARELQRTNAVAAGAPELRTLAARERAMRPFAEEARVTTTPPPSNRNSFDAHAVMVLASAGDVVAAAPFLADYRAVQAGAQIKNPAMLWPAAYLAAVAATDDDVDRAEAWLRAAPASGPSTPLQAAFLAHVGDTRLAARVLDDVLRDPRLAKGARLPFVTMVGERHPALAFACLRAHRRELLGDVPPTQQAFVVARTLTQTLWPAASPAQLAAFLRSAYPGERGVVDAAVVQIERSWHDRRALLHALDAARERPPATAAGLRQRVGRRRG